MLGSMNEVSIGSRLRFCAICVYVLKIRLASSDSVTILARTHTTGHPQATRGLTAVES